jgi:SAM-dependent methyltransferase
MSAIPSDYDSDPGRSGSFTVGWQRDIHAPVADRLVAGGARLVLDVGCGIGRFGDAVQGRMGWLGLDESSRQVANCRHRPVIRADASQLPVADCSVDAVVLLFMLYHLDQPQRAIAEGRRVLRSGGLLAACAASRHDHPELLPEGDAPTTFDAEEAPDIVVSVFGAAHVEVVRWDEPLTVLHDEEELAAYKRSHLLPPTAGRGVDLPVTVTKRGALVWGRKP